MILLVEVAGGFRMMNFMGWLEPNLLRDNMAILGQLHESMPL